MKTIQAIWSFKHKQYPDGSLNKHKALLGAHSGMEQWGVSYWKTYSPVVYMLTVCLLLALCNIYKLESKSIDFVLEVPQADLDIGIWMESTQGIVVSNCKEQSQIYVLKLKTSLYGLKQANLNWFEKLKLGLTNCGFIPLVIDPCLYTKKDMVVLTYVNDCIIVVTSIKSINAFICSMQHRKENFILTDEGNVNKLLGIEIIRHNPHTFEVVQPFLIDCILHFLGLCHNKFHQCEFLLNSSGTRPSSL
jgi:hypothetical protein